MKIKKNIILLLILSITLIVTYANYKDSSFTTQKSSKICNPSMVNLKIDRQTAIKLAEIVLVHIYGDRVLKQRPWNVEEGEDTFKIIGNPPMKDYWGGVAELTIRKSDAKIIHIIHGR